MNNIHTDQYIKCPTDLNFLHQKNYVRRAGIIPFVVYDGITYVLLGYSKEKKPVWADLGGRAEEGETTLETALREYGEESRNVLALDLNRIQKILITSRNGIPDQVILIVEIDFSSDVFGINDKFLNILPKNQYEDEMSLLQWIPYETFLIMSGLSSSLRKIQELLSSLTN